MRYFLALGSLVLGIVLLIFGAGQRAFLAGQHDIHMEGSLPAANYVVLEGAELSKIPGTQRFDFGKQDATVVIGNTVDVRAWVAVSGHTPVQIDAENRAFVAGQASAADAEVTLPEQAVQLSDSDLWSFVAASDGDKTLNFETTVQPWQAVLVAQNADAAAASAFSVHWHETYNTPWAGPLLSAGALFTLCGLVLYILFVDRDRRGLGPQRGKRGPLPGIRGSFKRKAKVDPIYQNSGAVAAAEDAVATTETPTADTVSETAAIDTVETDANTGAEAAGEPEATAAADEPKGAAKMQANKPAAARRRLAAVVALPLVTGLTLAGCSAEYWPQFGADDKPNAVDGVRVPTVSETQLSKIIEDVVSVAYEADTKTDAKLLESRFTEDAIKQREANYKIKAAVAEYPVKLPFLRYERLGYELVQQTEGWPRTVFVTLAAADTAEGVTAGTAGADSGAIGVLLQQASPFENFKAARVLTLRGALPEASPTEEGTAVLDNKLQTLQLSPENLGTIYAQMLAQGSAAVPQSELFNTTGDPVLSSGGNAWVEAEQARTAGQEASASYSVEAQVEGNALALSTGTGGAIVFTTVLENRTVQAGDNSEITVSNVVKAISGLDGKKKKVVQQVQHQLVFFVPRAEANEKIQLLGSSSEIIGAHE